MIRPLADNVVIKLLPAPERTSGGIVIPGTAHRRRLEAVMAEVVAVGPGHYRQVKRRLGGQVFTVDGPFIPTEVQVGDVVMVDPLAGQDYQLDISIPRNNKPEEFEQIGDERGRFRIVREAEIHCVVDEAEAAE